ncbi:hypothetical protein MPER_13448, partial [Moniliophthora perniciosa FA553]
TEVLGTKERMIGWYHSGPKLRASDQEINDLFKKYIARPVMVIVDVRPETVGIPADAYFAVEEIKDVMVLKLAKDSSIVPLQSKQKKQKKLALNIYYETSQTPAQRPLPLVSPNNFPLSAGSSHG